MRLHITYGDIKKVVEIESIEKLSPTLENEFNVCLDTCILYYFDKQFEDWVTVEKQLELQDKTKLLIKNAGIF